MCIWKTLQSQFAHSLEILDALVDCLDVVCERGGVGGAVVALQARLVLLALVVSPVDALHVRPQVAAARAPRWVAIQYEK